MAFGDWLAQKLAGTTLNSGGGGFAPTVVPSAPYQPSAPPNQLQVDMLRALIGAGLRASNDYTSGLGGGIAAPAPTPGVSPNPYLAGLAARMQQATAGNQAQTFVGPIAPGGMIPPPTNPAQAALFPHLVQAMQNSLPGNEGGGFVGAIAPGEVFSPLTNAPIQGPGIETPITPGSSLSPAQMALLAGMVKAQAAGTSGGGLLGGIGDAIGGVVSGAANTATNLANAGGDAIAGAASSAASAVGDAAGQVNQSLTDTLNASGHKIFGDKSLGERASLAIQNPVNQVKAIIDSAAPYVTGNPLSAAKSDIGEALHTGGEIVGWGQKKLEETQAEIAYKAATGDPIAKAEKIATSLKASGPTGALLDWGTKKLGMNLYAWADANPEAVKKAYEQGYDVYGADGTTVIRHVDAGPEAVAAAFDDSMNFLQQMGYQTLTDPTLLLLGAGPLSRSLKAVTAAEDAGKAGQVVAKVANVAGDALHAADVLQKAPEEGFKAVAGTAKDVAGRVLGVVPGGESVTRFFTELGPRAQDAITRSERVQAMKQAALTGRDFLFGEGGVASPAAPLDGGITPGAVSAPVAGESGAVAGRAADAVTPAPGGFLVDGDAAAGWTVRDETGAAVAGPYPSQGEAQMASDFLAANPDKAAEAMAHPGRLVGETKGGRAIYALDDGSYALSGGYTVTPPKTGATAWDVLDERGNVIASASGADAQAAVDQADGAIDAKLGATTAATDLTPKSVGGFTAVEETPGSWVVRDEQGKAVAGPFTKLDEANAAVDDLAARPATAASVKAGVMTTFKDDVGRQFRMMPLDDGTYVAQRLEPDGKWADLDLSQSNADLTDKQAVARAAIDAPSAATEAAPPAQAAIAPTEPVVPAESAASTADAADLANRKAKYAIADYMHEATKRIADSSEEATRAAYQRMQDLIGEKAARTQQTIALNESAAKRRYPSPNLADFNLTPADVAPSSQAVAPDVVAPSATEIAPTPDVAPAATEAAPAVAPPATNGAVEPPAAPTVAAPAGPPVLPQTDISFLGPKQGGQRAVDQAAYVIGPKDPAAARAFFNEYESMAADARLKFGRADWNAPIPQPETIKGLPRAEQDAARTKFATERLMNRADKVAQEMQFAHDTRAIWERTITPATGDAAPAVTMTYRDRLDAGNRRVFDDLFPREGETFRSARVIEDDQQWFGQMMHDVNSTDDIARGAATDVWNAVVEQALGPDNFAAKDVRAALSNVGPQGKALANDLRDMRVAILGEESVGSRGQLMAADARNVVTSGKRIAQIGEVQPKTYDFTLTYEDGTATTIKGFDTKKAAIQARESILQSHREAHAVEAGKLNQPGLFDEPAPATNGATEPAATDIANQPAPWETQSVSDLPPAATELPSAPASEAATAPTPAKPEPTGRWLREPDPSVGRLTPEKQEQINLWDQAKVAPNIDEAIQVFEDYATGKAGGAREEFMRRAANGRTAYENSEPGKLWRKVDGWIDNFTTDYNAYRPDGLNPHPSGRPPIEGSTAFPPEKPPLPEGTTPFEPATTVGGDVGPVASLAQGRAPITDPLGHLVEMGRIDDGAYQTLDQTVSVGGKWIKDPATGAYVLDGAKERRLFDVFAENMAKTSNADDAIKMTMGMISDKMPLAQREGIIGKLARGYKAVNQFGREHKMFGWARGGLGIATDAIGDFFGQATSGHIESLAESFNPKTVWGVFKDIRKGTETALANTEGGRIVSRLEVAPRDLYGLAQRSETDYGDEMGVARFVAKRFRSLGMGDESAINWASRVTRPLADKDIMIGREAADITRRWSLYTTQIKRELLPRREAFFDLIREKAATAGDVDAEKLIAGLGDEFGPSDVTRLAKEAGFADGQVTNLSRTWRKEVTAMDKAAWAEQNRVALDFSATRADEALKNVFMFHTWQTRAAPLYLQNALRNPVLADFYNHVANNMAADCEKRANATCGYLQLMNTGAGYAMYLNPTTLISSAIINLDPQFDDVNATTLDKILKQMPAQVAPAFQGIISAIGLSSRAAPDILSLDTDRKMVGGVVNYGRAHGWFGADAEHSMGDAFYAKALQLPAKVVAAAEEWTGINVPGARVPKWFDPHAQDNQLIQARMRDLVYQEYDVPLNTSIDDLAANYPQAYDALLGPDGALNAWQTGKPNKYSDQAFKDYTSGLLDRALLTPVIPGGVQIRSESQDALTARRDQAKAAGDAEAANAAGSALALPRLGSTAAVDLQYGQGLANVAGPEAGRELVKGWNKIVYGPSNQSPEDIARRKLIADEWVASHGSNAMALYQQAKTEKQAVIDANPESKAYQQWSGDIRNMDAPAFRNYLKSNPNYARYLDNLPADTKADPQKYESAKASTNAYLASQGEAATVFDPVAISTNSGKAPALTNPGGTGAPTYAKKDTATQVSDDLRKYNTDVILYNQALAAYTGNPNATLAGMNPMLRSVMASKFQQAGINQPSLPASVRRYQAWAAAQPAGSDTSIPRYAAWYDQMQANLAGTGLDAGTVIDAALSGVDVLANTGVVQSATSQPAAP